MKFIVYPCLLFFLLNICQSQDSWWKNSLIYQVYPRSFKDSNNDGIGDLQGITANLQHIKNLGVNIIWLSSIFESPLKDTGYDISNYTKIAAEYGNEQDLRNLIDTAGNLGMFILLDLVPNHTSDQSDWFLKSIQKDAAYDSYYIWHPGYINGTERVPPSNWKSVYGNSSWTYHETRGEYYLHQFLPEQPDLNLRNPAVVEEIQKVMEYYLLMGVVGFHIDSAPHLMESLPDAFNKYPDEELSGITIDENDYDYVTHNYTLNLPETYEFIKILRETLNATQGLEKLLIVDAWGNMADVMKYYDNETAHFPFNFELASLDSNDNARKLEQRIKAWTESMPEGQLANWVLGTHNHKRIAHRFGPSYAEGAITVAMMMPGIAVIYQGDEISMTGNQNISYEQTQDLQACNHGEDKYHLKSRDSARTPYQWGITKNAGFSINDTTWLPVPDDYIYVNFEKQDEAFRSTYKTYKELLTLRYDDILVYGKHHVQALDDNILMIKRMNGSKEFIALINTSNLPVRLDLGRYTDALFVTVKITSSVSDRNIGEEIHTMNNVYMKGYEAIVLRSGATKRYLSIFTIILLIITTLSKFL